MDPSLVLNRSRQAAAEETTAFGGIAERFRRAGALERAVALCREGLQKFPDHLSARVTLGWSLLDQGKYDEAQAELEQVLKRAPDNLAAIRGLAELHERAENAVELSLDGPGPWPPNAEAIKAAAPDEPHAPQAGPVAVRSAPTSLEPDVAALVETPAQAVARRAEPAAPIVVAATSPAPVELTSPVDLLTEPAADVAAIDLPLDLAEANAEALLKALDELEDGSEATPPVEFAAGGVLDEPVIIEPVLDDLASAFESASSAVDGALESVATEVSAALPEASIAEASPVEATIAEVAIVDVAVAEVSDGFALTAETASDAGASSDISAADAEPVRLDVPDTNSLSLDFETVPPEPVPAGPSPTVLRHQASIRVLERMLTRVNTRRVEVASEYHRAS